MAEGDSNNQAFDQCVSDFSEKVRVNGAISENYNDWINKYKKLFAENFNTLIQPVQRED